ncbi:hypothetical protein BDB01DRAFT_799357 [Pilobolus umbonatus]|nr:hypothetical protein BDB01DRAFT_799357 [Pilobolus umbonatus]
MRQLIPKRKSKDQPLLEQVEYYESEGKVVYTPLLSEGTLPFYYPKVQSYSLIYESIIKEDTVEDNGTIRLEIIPLDSSAVSISNTKMQYALKTIIHKLFKWCIQARLGYKKKGLHDVLVPKDTYQSMYQSMKSKYGPSLVMNWTEKTDPKKFVYEDIAIASYLLCLWKEEEKSLKRKPTFVDMGCGNGLLTYLLTCEGYQGYGVDIASRRIWSKLDNGRNLLRVEAIYPSNITYNADWLIGNHADELVPWIPIIASRSGDNCKFIVIPCCFYGLDGTRALSLRIEEGGKYRAYTDYIKNIASQAGFECEEDHLRIPSTKNIAILGRKRVKTDGMEVSKLIEIPSRAFVPRKTDREKEEERQESKKLKLTNS